MYTLPLLAYAHAHIDTYAQNYQHMTYIIVNPWLQYDIQYISGENNGQNPVANLCQQKGNSLSLSSWLLFVKKMVVLFLGTSDMYPEMQQHLINETHFAAKTYAMSFLQP